MITFMAARPACFPSIEFQRLSLPMPGFAVSLQKQKSCMASYWIGWGFRSRMAGRMIPAGYTSSSRPEEIMEALYCADNKATKLMKELESCGLIERKRRGLGKPSLIYVKNFISESSEPRIQSS